MAPIERAVERAGDAVVRLGYVPDLDLRALLGGADAFAYLPLAEGFGLPVAEALACGVPVVTSDRSSLPEVAGGAALLCDPTDPAAVANALARILDDPALRADLALRGLARAAELGPRQLALGTLAAYELALGTGTGAPRGAA
jgi:glycosyltransferase involved in cell wall biosynthesis